MIARFYGEQQAVKLELCIFLPFSPLLIPFFLIFWRGWLVCGKGVLSEPESPFHYRPAGATTQRALGAAFVGTRFRHSLNNSEQMINQVLLDCDP